MLTVGDIRKAIESLPDDSEVEIRFESFLDAVLEACERFEPSEARGLQKRLVITATEYLDEEDEDYFDEDDKDDDN